MANFAFIGDGATISADEQTIVDTIVAAGHTLARYGRDTGLRSVTGVGFLVLGPEGSSSGFNNWVTDAKAASVPILCMFHNVWDELGLHVVFSGQTSTPTTGAVRAHPIAALAGLTADAMYTWFTTHATTDRVFNIDNLGGGVTVVADDDSATGRKMAVAVEAGDLLADGVTPAHARLVGFGPASATWAASRTSDSILLLKAMADWVSGINPTSSGDTTAPSVAIANPEDRDIASGLVTLRASAADNVAVAGITFSVDGGSAIPANYADPYWEASLDTSGLTNAAHAVTATATDAASNTSTTAAVTFSVDNAVVVIAQAYLGGVPITDIRVGAASIVRGYVGDTLFWGEVPDAPAEAGTASLGPNGTHWPDNTPTLSEAFVYDTEAAATFTAIQAAIDNAPTSGNAIIRVQPGTFPVGEGAGSTDVSILTGGQAGRSSRILLVPRDGWGTVHGNPSSTVESGTTNGYSFSVSGVSMLGFDFEDQMVLWRNCRNSAFGWSTAGVFNITANEANVTNFQAVEVVMPNQLNYDSDRGSLRIANGYGASNVDMLGCYFTPSYKASGSSSHCDTWQNSRSSGGGAVSDMTWRDCVLFQSSSQVMMYEVTSGIHLDHTALIGGLRGTGRYPVGAGRHVMVGQNTLWGGSTHSTATDSIIMGSISSSHQFDTVTNSVTGATTSAPVASGSFTIDSQFADQSELETAWLDANAPVPALATIWAALGPSI